MSLRSYLRDELLLEGGKALKATSGIKQKHVKALLAELLPKLAAELQLPPNFLLPIGSAGKKPDPESLSGDIDIAVQTSNVERVLAVAKKLGVNGSYRAMPGINVYSFEAQHPDGTVQVDLIPVPDLKLAAWSYYTADADIKAGLKGSHRNEVLFALAKHVALAHRAKGDIEDAERTRYLLDLSRGLYKLEQTRIGRQGAPVKSYTTLSKELIATDPDEICRLLYGYNVPSCALLSFEDALKALHDGRFAFPLKRKDVLAMTAAGMQRKGLNLPKALKPQG